MIFSSNHTSVIDATIKDVDPDLDTLILNKFVEVEEHFPEDTLRRFLAAEVRNYGEISHSK